MEALQLRGRLLAGRYELDMSPFCGTLYRSAGVQQLGGTLLQLPFLAAPQASIR